MMLFDQGNYTFAQLWVPLAGMTLAVGLLSRQNGIFGKWFAWYSLVVALLLLVSRYFWDASGAAFTGYMLFWLWLIIASVQLIRRA